MTFAVRPVGPDDPPVMMALFLWVIPNRDWYYKVMMMTGSKQGSTLGFYRAAGFTQDQTAFQIRRF